MSKQSEGYAPLPQKGKDFDPPPPYTPPPEHVEPKWNDVAFIFLFAVAMLAVYVVIGFNWHFAQENFGEFGGADLSLNAQQKDTVTRIMILLAVTTVAGGLFTFGWLALARVYATQIIYIAIGFKIAIICFYIGFFLYLGAYIAVLIFAVFLVLLCLFVYWCRWRIALASVFLENVINILNQHKTMINVSVGGLVVSVLYTAVWIAAFISVSANPNATSSYLLTVYTLFSMYWFAQVVKNTVHVACAGTYATHILAPQPNATSKALRRALTYSFGSICFGSLIVALLQTLRAVLRGLSRNRRGAAAFVAACALCCLGIIEDIVRYFNSYAYTQVAIYGKSYCEAAKDTYHLFGSHGVDMLINDDWTGIAINMMVFMTGLLTGMVAAVATGVAFGFTEQMLVFIIFGFIIGLLIGIVEAVVCFEVIMSGIKAMFVCFALSRDQFRASLPALTAEIERVYGPRLGFTSYAARV